MTRARRRVVRLAHLLKVASVEPIFVGCTYREMQAGLEQQLSGVSPSRHKAVRLQALRLISEARGLELAADHLVPGKLQQGTMGRKPPAEPSLEQMPRWPPCPVCRMRSGRPKRSFPNQAAAQHFCEMQKDPGLVVYDCPAGAGFHLGHLPNTRQPTVDQPVVIAQRREPHRVNADFAPSSRTALQMEFPTKMKVTLANPFLIAAYSTALLFIGCGVGVHWTHTLPTALWLCIAGGVLMAAHDIATGFLWFWLTARWARSAIIQRNNRG
jgi:hypothetical protein